MARKPKTQPSPDNTVAVPMPEPAAPDEAAVPARRGRKPKAATLSFASPAAADVGSPASSGAGADAPTAAPTKAPGRKPKRSPGGEAAPSAQDGAVGLQDQAPGQPEAEVDPGLIGDDAPTAAAAAQAQAETAAASDPVQPDRDPVGPASPASKAAQSAPEAVASVVAGPAAHWDRATDRVRFDWPTIERVAAQGGPNQGMAKLLVAARAEGAGSRWPF